MSPSFWSQVSITPLVKVWALLALPPNHLVPALSLLAFVIVVVILVVAWILVRITRMLTGRLVKHLSGGVERLASMRGMLAHSASTCTTMC